MSFSPLDSAKNAIGVPQTARDYVDALANKYVVKPKSVRGIGGFVFDRECETTLRLQAEITDHWTEDNSAIHDHIAIKPTHFTLRGFVSELALPKPVGLAGALQTIQNRLTTVPAYLGHYTPQALGKVQGVLTKAQNINTQVDEALARANNVVSLFDNAGPGRTKQQRAYYKLQALLVTKQPLILDTPYGSHNNVFVESIELTQGEDTRGWSDITVTLKQLRFVEVSVETKKFGGRAGLQRAATVDKGKTSGTPVATSTAKTLKDALGL